MKCIFIVAMQWPFLYHSHGAGSVNPACAQDSSLHYHDFFQCGLASASSVHILWQMSAVEPNTLSSLRSRHACITSRNRL